MKTVKKGLTSIMNTLKNIPTKKLIMYIIVFCLSLIIILSYFRKSTISYYIDTVSYNDEYFKTSNLISGNETYTNKLISYKEENIKFVNENKTIDNKDYVGEEVYINDQEYEEIIQEYLNIEPTNKVFYIDDETSLKITVNDIESGVYYLAIDYYELEELIDNNQINIKINDETPFHESENLILKSSWVFNSEEFSKDRYGNEIQAGASKDFKWQQQALYDYYGQHPVYYGFYLKSGDVITIESNNNSLLVGSLYFVEYKELLTYEEYLSNYSNVKLSSELLNVAARDMDVRSEPSIRLRSEQDPSNIYYDTQHLELNTIFSESWQNGGQSVTYKFNVNETAMYKLSFKYRQNLVSDMPVFRQIKINGEVPFDLFQSYAFPYTTGFLNRKVVDENNKDVLIYLEAGENEVTLEAVNYPYRTVIEKIREIMGEIQQLALEVKRYTSGGDDPYRDWDIERYFPHADDNMLRWADELEELHAYVNNLSKESNPSQIANLIQSAKRLRSIAKNINRLPSKMVQFSDGDASVSHLLGETMQRLMVSGMELERTVFYGDKKLPKPYVNIFTSVFEGAKRLVLSYVNNPYSVSASGDDELNVWVNYPRQYIEILQAIIDEKYTGMRVTLSQMPDQNRLILANASGDAPDLALGVDHWIPYDFAIRDASLDLRQFEGYEEVVSNMSKGAIMPYIFEDGVFGLPETQNFWVTYYREDILSSIGVTEIPQTWDEIKALLPILQSYELNYFIPISQYVGLKPFVATLPFIYQFGGHLYTEDGMQTGISNPETLEGIRLMSELFTLYNMPKHVASFYNQFRYGMIPIGVSDLSTYILLSTTALELDGLWNIDLHPGTLMEDGSINRYSAAGAQSAMIMSTTKHKEESWDFLSWWLSTEIQSEFAFVLQNTYGKTYFWNTANLAAFNTISIPRKHREVILSQWEYALEAPRIPGSYMVEREISNAWTSMVFDGKNPRLAIDEAVRISNREILYKMAEFGYVENGIPVKDYPVPTIHNIDYWLVEAK